jgi:hypothetical protein
VAREEILEPFVVIRGIHGGNGMRARLAAQLKSCQRRGQNRPARKSAGRHVSGRQARASFDRDSRGIIMHASLAFVNGAGNTRRASGGQADREELRLLNALLSTAAPEAPQKPEKPDRAMDRGKSQDERQAEEESQAKPASKPGGFPNDPDDPTNPNEVRERHLNKIKP